MKKCLQCGVELEDDIKFCPECGFDLSLELFCPICKTPFKANQKKCNKCLTPLPKVNKKLPKELQKFNFSAFFPKIKNLSQELPFTREKDRS